MDFFLEKTLIYNRGQAKKIVGSISLIFTYPTQKNYAIIKWRNFFFSVEMRILILQVLIR